MALRPLWALCLPVLLLSFSSEVCPTAEIGKTVAWTESELVNSIYEEDAIYQMNENVMKTIKIKRNHRLFNNYASPPSDISLDKIHHNDVGNPLFITPLLKAGKIKKAQNMSRVVLPGDNGKTRSYSGYLTVDQKYGSNMFFWFFPAKENASTAPLLIWLQGGPGGSSLFGLFSEHGPFNVDENMNLVYRNYSWTEGHNMLYFDNPVGTGFSFTRSDAGYSRDEQSVGENLYRATQQFLQLFPDLRKQPLFVTGESYAGKYVPALAYAIHKHNPTAELKINLKGMAIGDGLCDPATMTDYGDFLYGVGLIDTVQRDVFYLRQQHIQSLLAHQLWTQAFYAFDELLNGDTTSVPSLFTNVTGLTFYFNYLTETEPKDMDYFMQYVNLPDVRRALHVGNLTFNDGSVVEQHLIPDVMQSVKPWIEELLDQPQYRVMVYSGQLDIIIAHSLTRNFVDSLQWRDAGKLRQAKRQIWRVDGQVGGYVRSTPNFVEVLVRGAGHMVPYDQPLRAYDMISRFTGVAGKMGFDDEVSKHAEL